MKKSIFATCALLLIVGCGSNSDIQKIDPQVGSSDSVDSEVTININEEEEEKVKDEGVINAKIPTSEYVGSYTISDEQYGTEVVVTVDEVTNTRTIVSNEIPNHETGTFPNAGNPNTISAQTASRTFPLVPKFTGEAKWVREAGVAINGVKFEPETNERVSCASGETYRIEAVQDMVNLGLDINNAHVQPTGAYHYHGVSQNLVEVANTKEDLVHIGFAADGHLIYFSKSGALRPSYVLKSATREGDDCTYTTPHESRGIEIVGTQPDGTYVSDWMYQEGLGDLDECDGITIGGQYIYVMSEDYPYIGRCLNGEFTQSGPSGSGPQAGGQGNGRPGGPQGGPPGRGAR